MVSQLAPGFGLVVLLLIAGCAGIGSATLACSTDHCQYSIRAGTFPTNTSLVVREGNETVDVLESNELSTGSVPRGTNVTAYLVNWQEETVRQDLICDTRNATNDTCTIIGEPIDLNATEVVAPPSATPVGGGGDR